MKIYITVTRDELDEMELSKDSLEEMICESDVADDLVGFDICVEVRDE